jgi:predicted transposase YdaD
MTDDCLDLDFDMKQTRFYQDAFREGRIEGYEQGLERGLLRRMLCRMDIGERNGKSALVSHLLEFRFGRLSADIHQRIKEADAKTLMFFAQRILDAKSLDEIFGD